MDRAQFEPDELQVLLRELNSVLNSEVPGDVVELGCYKGDTTVQIAKLLGVNRRLFAYDSFAGLPNKTTYDDSPAGTQFVAGELPASRQDVVKRLKQNGLSNVVVKKAWFSDLSPQDLPDKISFAFLDGDFYDSIFDSLKLVWPRLAEGAVVVVDDYQNQALPGAAKAVDQWLATHRAKIRIEKSLAILMPQLQK